MRIRALLTVFCSLTVVAMIHAQEAELHESTGPETLFDWTVGDPDWVSPAMEYDRLTTDRPHVSEATAVVGLGRIQLETGYTFFRDESNGIRTDTHSFPEPLLRIGVLAEWFELRLGYTYLVEQTRGVGVQKTTLSGSDDMLVGAKIALVKQRGYLPDISIFPQFRMPTGFEAFSGDRVLPGVNIAYSWAVNELIEVECNTVFSKKRDDTAHIYTELLQTANIEYDLGERWLAFTEYLAFIPSSAVSADFEHYFHYGIQYFITPDVQVDLHSSFGLNRSAEDLAFTGIGLSFRY